MAEKKTYDMRGRQSSILRLARFDTEALVHMLSFRALIFAAVAYGIVMLLSFQHKSLTWPAYALTAVVWLLFTPQVYETAKTLSLTSTRGLSFGHLSPEYVFVMRTKYRKSTSVFPFIPYAVMLFWLAGFLAMLAWWSI